MDTSKSNLLDFRNISENPVIRGLLQLTQRLAEPLLKTLGLNEHYRRFLRIREDDPEGCIYDQGLSVLNVRYAIRAEDLQRVPPEGPVFFMANHPYGGVDGLILGSLVDRVRKDGKLLVNYLLARVDNMGGRCFFVNPFGGPDAARANLRGMKESLFWLKDGHALATFPSGTVSHFRWHSRRVTDPVWIENLVPLIVKSGATVVPVFFSGRNSFLFQLAGMIHARMRTLLLPREMIRSRNRVIEVRIGNPISARRLQHFGTQREVMDFIRLRTYILQSRETGEKTVIMPDNRKARTGESIVAAQPAEKIEEELDDLPESDVLIEQDPFVVYLAKAGQIPHVLLELGRLREITFRKVGEGTGQSTDLDKFDADYRHLFIWNREEREIVGAYRLGLTDEILPRRGKNGLYTTTLFRFKPGVIASLDPAIELGRSFIIEKCQRRPLSLGLLWKGIGQFVVRNPKYCTLFGPVTISREYHGLSKNLMVAYLKENNLDPKLASKVKARNPARSRNFGSLDRSSFRRSVRDIEDVSALISEIERGERGVPVLLRQYLKLNATVLSFNLDPSFNDCLDGLVLVDLRKTAVRTLQKYMGREGAGEFLSFHNRGMAEHASSDMPERGTMPARGKPTRG